MRYPDHLGDYSSQTFSGLGAERYWRIELHRDTQGRYVAKRRWCSRVGDEPSYLTVITADSAEQLYEQLAMTCPVEHIDSIKEIAGLRRAELMAIVCFEYERLLDRVRRALRLRPALIMAER